MTRLENPDRVEAIVGVLRDPERHIARAVSEEQRVYILHSHECVNSGRDLRLCPYSLALDEGIDVDPDGDAWVEDEPHYVAIEHGRLVQLHQPITGSG